MLLDEPVDLIGGHAPVAVAGTDERAAVRSERGGEAGLVARQHLVDAREHQIRAFERAGDDHGPHHRRHLLARLAQRLLHGARVESLDRREPVLFGQAQDNPAAGAIGERGQRIGDGRGDLALAFLDLALLRIVADQTHEFDQLSHFGSIVIDHGGLLETIVPHNPPPARLQPRQFTPIHADSWAKPDETNVDVGFGSACSPMISAGRGGRAMLGGVGILRVIDATAVCFALGISGLISGTRPM